MPAPRVLLVLILLTVSGCMRWRQVHTLPAPDQDPVSLRTARVAVRRGSSPIREPRLVVLRDVRVTEDSVIGWRDRVGDRVAVHRDQVQFLETRGVDPWSTAGVSLLVLVVAYGAVVFYAISQSDF